MSCNYCWNQPIKHGKYDFYLDGKITANEIVYKVLTENKETENINLADKVQEIESRLQTHFEFKTVEVLPDEGEETVIYLVANDDKSGDKDGYNEYMWVKEKGEFELIGSGTYAQQQADLQAEIDRASAAEQVLTENLANEETARTNADTALDEKIANRVIINDPITITEGDNTTSITSDTISTTTLTGTLDAESMKNSLTAEAIQNVIPIAWDADSSLAFPSTPLPRGIVLGFDSRAGFYAQTIGTFAKSWTSSIAIGDYASAGYQGNSPISNWNIAIGQHSNAFNDAAIAIGFGAKAQQTYALAIGYSNNANAKNSLTFGSQFTETTPDGDVTHTCITQGTGSITIGAGANTLDNGDIESSNSVTIGCKAENKGADSVVIGAYANNPQSASVVIGGGARSNGNRTVAVGQDSIVAPKSVAVGYYARAHQDFSLALGANSDAAANNTIVIGYGATVTNTGDTQSENTTVIGAGASASAPNAVVLGAGAKAENEGAIIIGSSTNGGKGGIAIGSQTEVETRRVNWVAIGNGTKIKSNGSVVIGNMARSFEDYTVNIGYNTTAKQLYSIAIGSSSQADAKNSIAIGNEAKSSDIGAIVFRSTAEDGTKTQLYFSGQNTPLALKYYPTEWEKKQDVDEQGNPKVDDEGNPIMIDDKDKPTKGQAMMGYVVSKVITNDEGNQETKVLECGTNLLAALFPNHGLGDNPFQPTTTAIDGEEIMSFHPSDLDLPIEEPIENNDVEINIPTIETPIEEEYKPLPIYPIVEPTIEEITE